MRKVQNIITQPFKLKFLGRLVEFNIFTNYNFALASAKHVNNLTQSSFTNVTDLTDYFGPLYVSVFYKIDIKFHVLINAPAFIQYFT